MISKTQIPWDFQLMFMLISHILKAKINSQSQPMETSLLILSLFPEAQPTKGTHSQHI